MIDNIKRYFLIMSYSARLVAGRKFWIIIFLPLLWLAVRAIFILFVPGEAKLEPVNAHYLMSIPLSVVAIGLGVRLIAGEIDSRTLEIAYTVPGGCHRVWLAKIATSVSILLASEVLLTLFTMIFFTSVTPGTFYGVLQGAVFYLVMGMAFSTFFRSEITGAMATVALFAFNLLIGAGTRLSPFFNPLALDNAEKSQMVSFTIQNRIFFLIFIAVVTLLTFSRVERREKTLGD
jgi:ABC-type transport system involved in multi-copper enzyme maturation permease subunit